MPGNTPLRKLYAAFNAGETLVFDQAEIGWRPFAKLTASLGCELTARVNVNVYAAPPGPAQGFNVHEDLHDAFILQLEGTKKMEQTFRQLLASLADSAEFEDALVEVEANHLGSRAILPSRHFRRLAGSNRLCGNSVVAVREGLVCRVLLNDEHAIVYFADNHIRTPRWIEPALHYIEGNHREFCISDLPQPLSASSKLTLARRLVREGLLTIRSL